MVHSLKIVCPCCYGLVTGRQDYDLSWLECDWCGQQWYLNDLDPVGEPNRY